MTAPVDDVSPTTTAPSHHIRLEDAAGNKLLALIARPGGTDPKTHLTKYEPDPTGFTRLTFPNQAVRFTTQGGSYADLQPPFQAFEQKTWEGGRGIKLFESDKTRFNDAGGAITYSPNQITLGGLPRLSGGNFYGDTPLEHLYIMPGNFSGHSLRKVAMYSTDTYVGRRFSPTVTLVSNRVMVIIGQTGTAPGNFRVDIYSDNAGVPDASVANGTLSVATFGTDELAQMVTLDLNTNLTLTAGTSYWLIVSSVSAGSASNHWWVLTDDTAVGVSIRSANGSSWGEVSPYSAPYMAACDYYATATDKVIFKFFEYKRQVYAVSIPENGAAPVLYMNGYRGAADSNSGSLTKLKDSTQTGWATNAVTSGIVLIIGGPGADEVQPWRTITGSDTGELTVSPAWVTEHTTATEYVVLGTDFWTDTGVSPSAGQRIKSLHVVGDVVYFCPANNLTQVRRYREYNNAGTWTLGIDADSVFADQLVSIREQETGRTAVYGYNNGHALGPVYFKMYAPPAWGDLYREIGELVPTDVPWNTWNITNTTQSLGEFGTKIAIAAGFSTGVVAYRDLVTPLLIEEGQAIGMLVKSDVAINGTTELVQLILTNQAYRDQTARMPEYFAETEPDPYEVATKVTTLVPATGVHTNKPKIFDGSDASSDTIALTTTNKLVAVFSKKVNSVQFNVAVANASDQTLTMRYFNGEEFVLHTVTEPTWGGTNVLFGATGKNAVTFVLPADWQEYTVDDGTDAVTGYVLEFLVGGNIDGATALYEIAGKNTEDYTVRQLTYPTQAVLRTAIGERFNFRAAGGFYVGSTRRFSSVILDITDQNTQSATSAGYYFDGYVHHNTLGSFVDNTIDTGRPLFLTGTRSITWTVPDNWEQATIGGVKAYWILIGYSANLDDETAIDEIAVTPYKVQYTLNLPALVANQWTWCALSVTPETGHAEKYTIRNAALSINTDKGAQTIELKDGVHLISTYPELRGMNGQRATNILAYGANDRLEPYLLFEAQRHHRIDTLNNDALVPILITGMETIADETNGHAATHAGVYLYSNLGPRMVRYVDGNLESVGPDLDEGLPYNRQGVISSMITYVGDEVLFAVDAATRDPNFISAVYRRSNGIHELYRAPKGETIRDLYLQVIPGLKSDRLWINMGSHLVWVPISSYTKDPLKDLDSSQASNVEYTWDGYVDLGYITDGMQGVVKIYVSLTLITRNLSGTSRFIQAYYRKDDTTTWTKIATTFTTSPVQEIAFATNYVSGKKLQIRLRLMKDASSTLLTTPVIEGVVVKAVTIYPASYLYQFNALIGDNNIDRRRESDQLRAETKISIVDTWRNSGEVLTLTDLHESFSSKKVVIQSIGSKVSSVLPETQHEQHYMQFTLLDITL